MRRWYRVARWGVVLGALGWAMSVGGGPAASAAEIKVPTRAVQAAALSHVPAVARKYYDHYWYNAPVTTNPYANWTPPKPPWQVCDSDSMLGTSWRTDLFNEIKKLNAQYHKAGLTKAKVLVTDSNNNISVQLTQVNNLSREGCNIIISTPSNPTGLCQGFHDSRMQGVLNITVESPVTCNEAINVGANQYYGGRELAAWVGKELKGKGNVLILSGVPGISTTIGLQAGSKAALAKWPGIHVLGVVYGFWNEATAKTQMVKWLATHPEKIDGIVSYGDMAVAADEALKQFGRPLAVQSDGTNECAYIAYWHEHKLHSFALLAGGGSNGYEAFYVAMKMMFGQKPTTNMIWVPLPPINDAEAARLYKLYPGITQTSTCWADEPNHHLVADSYINQFFKGGKKVEPRPNP
ncbi:MAG: substrate-binding domain-containing protein [Stellaceae bacterium]